LEILNWKFFSLGIFSSGFPQKFSIQFQFEIFSFSLIFFSLDLPIFNSVSVRVCRFSIRVSQIFNPGLRNFQSGSSKKSPAALKKIACGALKNRLRRTKKSPAALQKIACGAPKIACGAPKKIACGA